MLVQSQSQRSFTTPAVAEPCESGKFSKGHAALSCGKGGHGKALSDGRKTSTLIMLKLFTLCYLTAEHVFINLVTPGVLIVSQMRYSQRT